MYINFENKKLRDECGNYTIDNNQNKSLLFSSEKFMGQYAASFKNIGGIKLEGNSDSIFGRSGLVGSFSIDFWLKPSIVESGEILFMWRSSRSVGQEPIYQMITVAFVENHLEWIFSNIFTGYETVEHEIKLSGRRSIIPGKWVHHQLSYDNDTGLIEYRVNGMLESLVYSTTNGRERGGSVCPPLLGVKASIELCPYYTGLIDDFRIKKCAVDENFINTSYDIYMGQGGRFESEPIMVSKGASLKCLNSIYNKSSQTDIIYYVRSGDNFYNWDDNYPEWKKVNCGESLQNISGLYFQVACELYPDGSRRKTPSVTSIDLVFDEVELPLPPVKLIAVPGDGEVTLSWPLSVDNSIGGYYVFYGERSGEYLGRDCVLGESPIDVGNTVSVKLTGLENGKIYYFSVASYSSIDENILGELSKEVYARPLRK